MLKIAHISCEPKKKSYINLKIHSQAVKSGLGGLKNFVVSNFFPLVHAVSATFGAGFFQFAAGRFKGSIDSLASDGF
jgi:hypothetical protein